MVAEQANTTAEQTAARAALAAAIAETATRLLPSHTDEELLARTHTSWAATTRRAVRAILREQHATLANQLSERQLSKLLTKRVRAEVRWQQFAAFERYLTALDGPIDEEAAARAIAAASHTINGTTVVEVELPETARRECSADD